MANLGLSSISDMFVNTSVGDISVKKRIDNLTDAVIKMTKEIEFFSYNIDLANAPQIDGAIVGLTARVGSAETGMAQIIQTNKEFTSQVTSALQDVNTDITDVKGTVTTISQKADSISLSVGEVKENLKDKADKSDLNGKADKANIISQINLSKEQVKILSEKIELIGVTEIYNADKSRRLKIVDGFLNFGEAQYSSGKITGYNTSLEVGRLPIDFNGQNYNMTAIKAESNTAPLFIEGWLGTRQLEILSGLRVQSVFKQNSSSYSAPNFGLIVVPNSESPNPAIYPILIEAYGDIKLNGNIELSGNVTINGRQM